MFEPKQERFFSGAVISLKGEQRPLAGKEPLERHHPWLQLFGTHQMPSAYEVKFCKQRFAFWNTNLQRRRRSALGHLWSPRVGNQHQHVSLSRPLREWGRCLDDLWYGGCSLHRLTMAHGPKAQTALSAEHFSGNGGRVRQREKNKPPASLYL